MTTRFSGWTLGAWLALAVISPLQAQSISNGGSAGGGGGVSNVATGACLTGGPITSTGTIAGTYVVDERSTTTESITSADACELVKGANASTQNYSIGQATGSLGDGWATTVANVGPGDLIITPTTSTINGAASLTLKRGESCEIISKSGNYVLGLCKGAPSGVTAGSYGSASNCPTIVVAASGIVTSASQTACSASGGVYPVQYYAGRYYWSEPYNMGANLTNQGTSKIIWRAIVFGKPITLSSVGARVVSTSAAGNFAIALYAADATTGLPTGAAICNTGNLSTTTAAAVENSSISCGVSSGGLYWWGFQVDNATATFMGVNSASPGPSWSAGAKDAASLAAGSTQVVTEMVTTTTYGTWPTMNGTECGTGNCVTSSAITASRGNTPFFKVGSIP